MARVLRPVELIKGLREWGMSLNRIARECGSTEPTIYRIYSGLTKRPKVETEQKLRALYDKYIGDEQ